MSRDPVYVGSDNGKLYALDATTGTLKWSYDTGNYITSSPVVANGIVYIGSQSDKFFATTIPSVEAIASNPLAKPLTG